MSVAAFPSGLAHLLLLLLALAGFAALALAMERHQEDVFGKALSQRITRSLRIVGWISLLLCLWLAVAAKGWSFGLVAYSGHTSGAAGIVFIALLLWNRWLERKAAKASTK